jgi:hypothetical protein
MHIDSDLPTFDITNEHSRLDDSSVNIPHQNVDACDAASINVSDHSIERMRRTPSDIPHHDVDVTDDPSQEVADDQIRDLHLAASYGSQEQVACLDGAGMCASTKDIDSANQPASKVTLAAVRSYNCFATQDVACPDSHRSAER